MPTATMHDLLMPSMSCQHCVRAVTETVQRIDPQATVQVDLAQKRVRIESRQPLAPFTRALTEEGYAPS